ncbi:MAG: anhydro-N-acetylmuramic acid kinase [Gallionella sp.]|nr:anhydro-N-acetylmuramic acid kinase [Gallionella sp.]MDP1941785.1 anhydro-N-acetylmuramic acid kinase [Gallionella sp.]
MKVCAKHQTELYVGLMSGTSLDGIDAVLVAFGHPHPVLISRYYLPYHDTLKQAVLDLHQPSLNELHQTQLVGNQLAQLYAQAVNALLAQTNYTAEQIMAIGCHGQTIRHCPEHGYTLQIGNAALLAELTGITVVSDFRSRDIAAGGQGAPLVPAFHDKLLRHPERHRVIVNIGGISNLTNLPPHGSTSGFDCGPGNLMMDAWCMQHLKKPFDANGDWAKTGKVLPELLGKMLAEPFFALAPPKSSGRDLFNMAWLQSKLKGNKSPEDVQATLTELTAQTIALAINAQCNGAEEIYLCGGGAHNQVLRTRLAGLLPTCSVQTTDILGVDGDYLEAIAFAWLSQQALLGQAANLPLVTGARHPCILGAIYSA